MPHERLEFDIETDGFLENVTKVHSLVIRDMDTGTVYSCHDQHFYRNPRKVETLSIRDGVTMLSKAKYWAGHNIIKYDIPVLRKLFPAIMRTANAFAFDTLVVARLVKSAIEVEDDKKISAGKFPPRLRKAHSLEAWGVRLGELKGDFGKAEVPEDDTGESIWSKWTPEMQEYCEQDVRVTTRLHKFLIDAAYSDQAIQLELAFADILAEMERNGFGFNEAAAGALYAELAAARMQIRKEIQEVIRPWWKPEKMARHVERVPCPETGDIIEKVVKAGEVTIPKRDNAKLAYTKGVPFTKVEYVEFNPASRQHVADRLRKVFGWEPSEFTETGLAKVDETILMKLPWKEARLIADFFMVEKRIGQLAEGDKAWIKMARKGKIHGSVNTNGANGGRCTHSNPNVAQVPSVQLAKGEDGKEHPVMGRAGGWGYECRALWGPTKPGWVQVGVDASGLELRCLGHFMALWDKGEYIKVILEGDIHTVNQLAAGLPKRAMAKTFIYAFLYGAGDEKIGDIVNPLASAKEKARIGERLKAAFLAKTPALKKLVEKVKERGKKLGYLIGLDGRRLHVRSLHSALNTLLQSAGALIMKQATVLAVREMQSRGYKVGKDFALMGHIHDEMQFECRKELADELAEVAKSSITQAGEVFGFNCPLAGDAKFGNNWAETH